MLSRTFGFRKMQDISEELLTARGLCFMEIAQHPLCGTNEKQ